MNTETHEEVEQLQLLATFHDEYAGCSETLEQAFIEHFLFDESRSIEERKRICSVLCELLAFFSAAINLNSVVKASGIREQMYEHFGL